MRFGFLLGSAVSRPFSLLPFHVASNMSTGTSATAATNNSASTDIAYLANGCFWGPEHEFRKYFSPPKRPNGGILDIKVGYMGGNTDDPTYRQICSGTTGHAEAVKIEYDTDKIGYDELIEFHYRMHDASQVNRQGPDVGTQYRSVIFYANPTQQKIANEVTTRVQKERYSPNGKTIATEIVPAGKWYDAEEYHQRYLEKNPSGYHCPSHRMYW